MCIRDRVTACDVTELLQSQNRLQKEKHPSFFEFLFLMGMCYFKEKEPDYIILETGLGGRLDATNCIATVSYTHLDVYKRQV